MFDPEHHSFEIIIGLSAKHAADLLYEFIDQESTVYRSRGVDAASRITPLGHELRFLVEVGRPWQPAVSGDA